MVYKIYVWALTALICQVQSQQCNCPNSVIPPIFPVPTPILPAPITTPILCPQQIISPPPVISTTIVDNSVANSLANALQLLIVSELIGNTINTPICPSPYCPQLCDGIPSIGVIDYPPVLDVSYGPHDTINYGPVVDVSSNVVTEVIAPSVTNIGPTVYGGTEIAPPPIGYPGIYNPNIYAPVNEVYAPVTPITEVIAPVTSSVTTNVYGGITEVNPYGPEFVSPYNSGPSVDVYTNINEVINPVVSAPRVPYNPYYDVPDIIPPFTPGCITEITDVCPRDIINPYIAFPPVCGGYPEMISPVSPGFPYPAEVIFPQSIPAHLKCNFGYPRPCSQYDIEPVPFVDPFIGGPCFY